MNGGGGASFAVDRNIVEELPTMLTVTEVARMLRVSRPTVERMCERGQVRGRRTPGGNLRRPIDAVITVMSEMGLDEAEIIDTIRTIARRTR